MRRLCALLLVPLFLLTACGGDSDDSGDATGSSNSALDAIKVNGAADKAPKIDVGKNFSVDKTATEVLSAGDGPEVPKGDTALVHFMAVNSSDGQVIANTYKEGNPQPFVLDKQKATAARVPPVIIESLMGKKVGDRVLAAYKPQDVFGQQQQGSGGGAVVFVFDIEKASDPEPLQDVEGKTADLPATLPQLKLDKNNTPTGFQKADAQAAPKKLGVHTLIEGDGPKVESGDLLTVNYLGQIYPDGKVFDESYSRGEPVTFQVGVGQLIPAWDEGLVGLEKGSRVALVVPPQEGYGKQGNPQAGIKGTDTLIFVVDILGVA